MDTITVTYTPEEAAALLKLIDLAVRQGGMDVAEAAVVLSRKVRESAQAQIQQPVKSNGKESELVR